jgi:hypothetical protein
VLAQPHPTRRRRGEVRCGLVHGQADEAITPLRGVRHQDGTATGVAERVEPVEPCFVSCAIERVELGGDRVVGRGFVAVVDRQVVHQRANARKLLYQRAVADRRGGDDARQEYDSVFHVAGVPSTIV